MFNRNTTDRNAVIDRLERIIEEVPPHEWSLVSRTWLSRLFEPFTDEPWATSGCLNQRLFKTSDGRQGSYPRAALTSYEIAAIIHVNNREDMERGRLLIRALRSCHPRAIEIVYGPVSEGLKALEVWEKRYEEVTAKVPTEQAQEPARAEAVPVAVGRS